MSGLLTSFYSGVSGLRNNQNSLNMTGHNIVNADTPGFVRQQVIMSDGMYKNLNVTPVNTNQVGTGSRITTVRQVRDIFLDASYRKEYGRQGFYDAQSNAIDEIENLFGELEGVQFQTSLEGFWNSIQELAKEPDSIVARASVVQTATTFLERADIIGGQLNTYQTNLNTKIINSVDRINEIGGEIHKLNQTIRTYESGPEHANDFRDQRNALLDELGNMVKITYKENPDHVVTVNIEGSMFVSEADCIEMELQPVEQGSKLLIPVWDLKNGAEKVFNFDAPCTPEADTDIGYLKGLLLARGSKAANYTDIPTAPDEKWYTDAEGVLDEEAYDLALADYMRRTDEYNNDIYPSVIMNTQAQFDQLTHGVITAVNDVLCPNITATWGAGDIVWRDSKGNILAEEDVPELTAGDLEEYAKITYDEEGNELSYSVSILDLKNAPVGMDENHTVGEALFNRMGVTRYTKLDEDAENPVYVYTAEDASDRYSLFTLGEIEINNTIKNNLSVLPLSDNGGTGDFSLDVSKKLAEIWNESFATLNPNTLTKNTFIDYYTAFTGDIANRGQTLKAVAQNQETTAVGVDNQRQQIIGVSTDEELTQMIKFQHAYNAASRYITVIDNMLEHIIVQLGS